MGINLMILPTSSKDDIWKDEFFAYTRLKFEIDYDIFCQIIELNLGNCKPKVKPLPLPVKLWVHLYKIDGCYAQTRKDEYGKDLTYLYAEEFKKIQLPADASPMNVAIKAYIDALPNDLPIILWWC